MTKNVIIIKFGGSVITDKSIPFSVKNENIKNLCNQIALHYHDKSTPLIIVHGGGSFGHPLAHQYHISKGFDQDIPGQILGLTKTHQAMEELNKIIRDSLISQNVPVISFPPVDSFSKNNQLSIKFSSNNSLLASLQMNIIPLFYGDIVFQQTQGFGILSGDQIIQYLCENLPFITDNTYFVEKVIFCFDKDGILQYNSNKQIELIKRLSLQALNAIPVIQSDGKIDVTSSLSGKLIEIKKIVELNIPVILLNGNAPNRLFDELNLNSEIATRIEPDVKIEENKNEIIYQRKDDHLRIALQINSQSNHSTWLDHVRLIHQANPRLDYNSIDTRMIVFKKQISFPLFIGALTGGTPNSFRINKILAEAAEKYQIGMMVGSQRIALNDSSTIQSFKITRESAPSIPLVANIGIPQLIQHEDQNQILDIINHINADALAVHLNPLQEIIQHEGEPQFAGTIRTIENLVKSSPVPIIIKETGAGLSKECVEQFYEVGVRYFDTAGLGGTNFAAIEMIRNAENIQRTKTSYGLQHNDFTTWGIPSAASIIECAAYLKQKTPSGFLFGSGGIRSALDMVKSGVLGADCCCMAQPLLVSAMKGIDNLSTHINLLQTEFKKFLFLSGAVNMKALSQKSYILESPLKDWIEIRKN